MPTQIGLVLGNEPACTYGTRIVIRHYGPVLNGLSQPSVNMFTPCNRGSKIIEIISVTGQHPDERRACARAVLGCAVILFRPGGNPICGDVHNISSDGFYCTCAEPFGIGDSFWCDVQVPLAAICVDYTDLVVSCIASV